MHSKQMTISIAGSGHVAFSLAKAFVSKGIVVEKIWSRSEEGRVLAAQTGARFIPSPELFEGGGPVLLCLSDQALQPELFRRFPPGIMLAHTAGSVPLSAFGSRKNVGVFYPLQTFSKNREVDFSRIPFCLEADSESGLEKLQRLASALTGDVRLIDSKQRRQIHLAAVFVSNFVNHLYKIAGDLLHESRVDRSVLFPLMEEVTRKALEMSPADAQTGPALRGDDKILNQHLQMLEKHPDYQVVYKILSQSIKNNTRQI